MADYKFIEKHDSGNTTNYGTLAECCIRLGRFAEKNDLKVKIIKDVGAVAFKGSEPILGAVAIVKENN